MEWRRGRKEREKERKAETETENCKKVRSEGKEELMRGRKLEGLQK